MPSGVFQPYSGVSTAILIFTKTNAGGTDKVWFYDMKADGFSLDQKRNEVAENDIPDVVARFHNLAAEADRTRKEQSFLVPVEEIREKGYDLSMNKYKEVEREVVTYDAPEVIMERIVSLETQINDALNEFRAKFMQSMNILEIIGVVASVVTIVSFVGSLVYKIVTSKSRIRRKITRKEYKIQEIENQIFLLERNPLALMRINQLKMKQAKLQEEIFELQQDL